MRIYIWEGNGVSEAYHDDGLLVVLAESPEQAREVVRASKRARDAWVAEHSEQHEAWYRNGGERAWMQEHGVSFGRWETAGGKALLAERAKLEYPDAHLIPDGADEALDREPDRVLELNAPTIVAFNGGGYD